MDKREKVHEILDLVLDINGMEERKKKLTGEKPTVFFEFSGHTSGLEIRICEKGWSNGVVPEIWTTEYLSNKDCKLDEIINQLQKFKEEMANVL